MADALQSPAARRFRQRGTFERLKSSLRVPNAILVGAAIGTGMAAQAAARGGADILLALNAGRLRSMGVPSIASLLALRDSNALVMDFARAEILPMAQVPVFLGACVFDPRQNLDDLIGAIADAGFQGVVNFPTSVFLDGEFRRNVEAAGIGFGRELTMLCAARARGLTTLGYVHTVEEAEEMAKRGIDIINLNLGWNTGGQHGVKSALGLDEAAEYAKYVFRTIRKRHPSVICMLEGGPIVSPEEMYQVCRTAKADGYIGGSTIDRVPLETSIESVTWAFKAVGTLQRKVDQLERRIVRVQRDHGVVGASAHMRRVQRLIDRLAPAGMPVVIVGEEGTGKQLVARALHNAGKQRLGRFVMVDCERRHVDTELFGGAPGSAPGLLKRRIGHFEAGGDTTIFLNNVGTLSRPAQERLLKAIETGAFQRMGEDQRIKLEVRVIVAARRPLTDLVKEGKLDARLRTVLRAAQILLPPLRERLEDLPLLAAHFLWRARGENARALSLDHLAYRTLMSHHWPGNVRELRAVVEQAAAACEALQITRDHLPPLGTEEAAEAHDGSEREWILDGLRRNRFRRTATARFLGISRKTLYNKMKTFGLPLDHRQVV